MDQDIGKIDQDRLNYFVCTLGQASEINEKGPHEFTTINEFIDFQAEHYPDSPAVGFSILVTLSYGDIEYTSETFSSYSRSDAAKDYVLAV